MCLWILPLGRGGHFLGAKAPLELVRLSGSVSNEKVSKQQDLFDLIEELYHCYKIVRYCSELYNTE